MATRLTKKEKAFANEYINTGVGTTAALKAYDTDDYMTAASIASENLKKPKVIAYIESKAEKAAEFVFTLAETGENENVRLSASKDILDRAGFKPVEKSLNINTNIEVAPNENLKELANALLQRQRAT